MGLVKGINNYMDEKYYIDLLINELNKDAKLEKRLNKIAYKKYNKGETPWMYYRRLTEKLKFDENQIGLIKGAKVIYRKDSKQHVDEGKTLYYIDQQLAKHILFRSKTEKGKIMKEKRKELITVLSLEEELLTNIKELKEIHGDSYFEWKEEEEREITHHQRNLMFKVILFQNPQNSNEFRLGDLNSILYDIKIEKKKNMPQHIKIVEGDEVGGDKIGRDKKTTTANIGNEKGKIRDIIISDKQQETNTTNKTNITKKIVIGIIITIIAGIVLFYLIPLLPVF